MKCYGRLFDQIVAFQNLWDAAHRAALGKKHKAGIARFLFQREWELLRLQMELIDGTYQPCRYRIFTIYEPKERQIAAADFRDRVVHHAICHILDPIFEAGLIYDTYACRQNKGTHVAVKRAQYFARRNRYYLKCDIRKFFFSVDHAVLKFLLRRKLKDKRLLNLLDIIIDHPVPGNPAGKGLPIGNLTSQYFANFYLASLDHFVQQELRAAGYLRYMDDFILFSDSKVQLHEWHSTIRSHLTSRLILCLKDRVTRLAPVSEGVPFLGFRIFPNLIRLQGKNWRRFQRRFRLREQAFRDNRISGEELLQSARSMIAHIQHADTRQACKKLFESGRWLKEM